MDLSVVIATIKPRDEIESFPYLKECAYDDYELLVRDEYPVTRARNEGYRRANTDKIVYLDDDSRPRDGYLSAAAETLESQPAVAGLTVHPRDDVFAGQLTSHYDFGDEPGYVDHFWGCNMGLRREVLEDVGGWDERMGWGHEEKELADRVTEEYAIYYNPEMVVDHVYAESLPDYWRKRYDLEKQIPYYLAKQGLSEPEMVVKIISDALDPTNYVARTPSVTLAKTGSRLVGTAGRLAGLYERRTETAENQPPGTQSANET